MIVNACDCAIRRAIMLVVTVGASGIMVLLGDYRIGPTVAVDSRSHIPAEQISCKKLSGRTELHQVSLSIVVTSVGAVEHASIRKNDRRRGGVIYHSSGRRLVGIRSNTRSRALPAAPRCAVGWNKHIAAIIQAVPERGGPFGSQVRIDRDDKAIP